MPKRPSKVIPANFQVWPSYRLCRHVLDVIFRMSLLSRSFLAAASQLPRNFDARRKIPRSIVARFTHLRIASCGFAFQCTILCISNSMRQLFEKCSTSTINGSSYTVRNGHILIYLEIICKGVIMYNKYILLMYICTYVHVCVSIYVYVCMLLDHIEEDALW
jgi:hypothetical protein